MRIKSFASIEMNSPNYKLKLVDFLQDLSFGGDSNGSGIAVLLELARIFSNLYRNPRTHGRYNIIFLLSGAGKMNYLGTKKYLEDQIDSLEGSLLQVCFKFSVIIFQLEDLGDEDIALGPDLEVKICDRLMMFSTETGRRFLPLSVVLDLVRCRRLQDLLVLQERRLKNYFPTQ